MNRLIAIIVIATFLPMQAYAARPLIFDPVEQEHLMIPVKPAPPPVSVPVEPPPVVVPTPQPVLPPPTPTPPVAQPVLKETAKPPVVTERERTEKLTAAPPAPVVEEKSGTNWWLWGGLGLVAVAGGIFALVGGKSGGSGSTTAVTPATVNASW
jgi:hypothetical protein